MFYNVGVSLFVVASVIFVLTTNELLGFKLFKLLGVKTLAKSMALTYKADYAIKAREYMTKVSLKVDLDQMIMARKAINTINVLDALKKNTYEALCICGSEFGKSFIDINRKIADALKTDLVYVLFQIYLVLKMKKN